MVLLPAPLGPLAAAAAAAAAAAVAAATAADAHTLERDALSDMPPFSQARILNSTSIYSYVAQ